MIFVGDDWAEDHHDVAIVDEAGKALVAHRRLPEGVAGVAALHELIAGFADEPGEVVVGIETDRGLWVMSLVAAGYQVYAVNPLSVARYRQRHVLSGPKSDPGRRRHLGRPGPHRPSPSPPDSRRLRGRRGAQGGGPSPSAAHLGPPTPSQPAALDIARVLPRSARRVGNRPGPSRRVGPPN